MKKRFILLLTLGLIVGFISSCTKNENIEVKDDVTKEIVTTENIGEVHNYLLGMYRQNIKTKSSTEKISFGEVYQEMEKLLSESDKYSMETGIVSNTKSFNIELLESLNNLPLDSNFPSEMKKIYIEYLKTSDLDQDIVAILLKSTEDYMPIDMSLIKTKSVSISENELLCIYNNVYKSSSEYWSLDTNINSNTKRAATNTEIIFSDAAGALLGAGCGGIMSICMGAAFSHCMERCAQMSEN